MDNVLNSLSSSLASLKVSEKAQSVVADHVKPFKGGSSFRTLPVIPKTVELFNPHHNFLRENIVIGPYESDEHYLDVQFRLLREDFLRSVKEGLKSYMARKKFHSGIKVHSCISLIGNDPTGNILELKLSADLLKRVNSEDTKRFIPGSLLLFTKDNLKTTYLGLIRHDDQTLEESHGLFQVQIKGDLYCPPWRVGEKFVTIECDAYFEPYRSVMNVMKSITWLHKIPLWKYLKDGCGNVGIPKYLKNRNLNIGSVKVKPDDKTSWPLPEELGLDIAQFKAFQAALTQEFVIVQGPPGTGKTYLGLQIIKTLMEKENMRLWRGDGGGPIIIVCYTNHALDQFGEGILDLFTPPEQKDAQIPYKVTHPRLFRLGRGCQSSRLMDYQPPRRNWAGSSVDIVLMTTTGAAIRSNQIMKVRSRIMIVEEAAEVVEQHVIACLTPHIEHLILLGDHQQLRPITASSDLTDRYHMDVSLFERMVKNDFPRYQLQVQHRMRPQIRELITGTIYPTLSDHPRVNRYPSVTGMARDLFFIDHRQPESEPTEDSFSRSNDHEAKFLGALCEYLLGQGYKEEKITVLGMYMRQVRHLENEIWGKRHISKDLRIETADSFQGEENDIILLSLVRSNRKNNIGFMKTDNRICVALSRAKHGLYIIGNMELLAANSRTWSAINLKLKSNGNIGPKLILECDKHNQNVITEVVNERDFWSVTNHGCRVCSELAADARLRQKALDASKKSSRKKRNRKTAYYNNWLPID